MALLSCSEVNPTGFSGATVLSGETRSDGNSGGGAGGGSAAASEGKMLDALSPCSEEAEELFAHLTLFRQQNGLGPITASPSLCSVAEAHLTDLQARARDAGCTEHSWSAEAPGGECCHTADGSKAECIQEAPARLTGYEGEGHEMLALDTDDVATAFRSIRDDEASRALLLNEGKWASMSWLAVGAAVSHGDVSLWLGDAADDSASD